MCFLSLKDALTLCPPTKVWSPELTTRWRYNPADRLKVSGDTPGPGQGATPVEEGQCWGQKPLYLNLWFCLDLGQWLVGHSDQNVLHYFHPSVHT